MRPSERPQEPHWGGRAAQPSQRPSQPPACSCTVAQLTHLILQPTCTATPAGARANPPRAPPRKGNEPRAPLNSRRTPHQSNACLHQMQSCHRVAERNADLTPPKWSSNPRHVPPAQSHPHEGNVSPSCPQTQQRPLHPPKVQPAPKEPLEFPRPCAPVGARVGMASPGGFPQKSSRQGPLVSPRAFFHQGRVGAGRSGQEGTWGRAVGSYLYQPWGHPGATAHPQLPPMGMRAAAPRDGGKEGWGAVTSPQSPALDKSPPGRTLSAHLSPPCPRFGVFPV